MKQKFEQNNVNTAGTQCFVRGEMYNYFAYRITQIPVTRRGYLILLNSKNKTQRIASTKKFRQIPTVLIDNNMCMCSGCMCFHLEH